LELQTSRMGWVFEGPLPVEVRTVFKGV